MKLVAVALLVAAPLLQESKKAEELLRDALAQAKESKKKVFLTIGSPGSDWCGLFEAWKARPEVAPLLAREFILLPIDTSKTPGGSALRRRYPKAQDQGVPWFVIHDGDAKELADSNGPKGNIGFPSTDEEIELFMGILKKVSSTLKEEDLALLKKSLLAQREKK
jgi:hypothetical protein